MALAALTTVLVLSMGLADSTRPRYDACENHLLSVCSCNQRLASQQWRVVRRLHDEVCELREAVTELKDALITHKKPLLGSTSQNAGKSCKQILDCAGCAENGVYWVCASPKCTVVKEVYCDMRSGGWTLIGQIGNVRGNFQNEWLVTNKNTAILQTPVIQQGTYGWIDAVDMAVNHAKEIRLSNSGNNGMGRYWVEWDLPTDRKVDTFWRNSVGPSKIRAAANCEVEVRSSFTKTGRCYQNKYGINGYYGGGYPSTTITPKTLKPNDVCMTVAAVSHNSPLWHMPDWSKYYNDAPKINTDWPNVGHIYGGPFLSVWLR